MDEFQARETEVEVLPVVLNPEGTVGDVISEFPSEDAPPPHPDMKNRIAGNIKDIYGFFDIPYPPLFLPRSLRRPNLNGVNLDRTGKAILSCLVIQ